MIETMIGYGLMFTVTFTPYIFGGNDPTFGVDCSGFAIRMYRTMGYGMVDMTAQSMHDELKHRFRSGIRRGGLLFFGDTQHKITHVAISLGDGTMLEAGGGDRTTTSEEKARKIGARVRISNIRSDLVAALYDETLI